MLFPRKIARIWEVYFLGTAYEGLHEAIVSEEAWEMARKMRERRRNAPRTYQPGYRWSWRGKASTDRWR
jgi:hypothetical protein